MVDEKLFYKYQSLKVALNNNGKVINDDNDNDIVYTIENLAKNQLFFRRPDKFNDPYDCRPYCYLKSTRRKYIDHLISLYEITREEIESYIDDAIEKGEMTIDGDLICYDPMVEKDSNLHGYSLKESLPRVCCFSGNDKSILMWSHYANNHQGICLRFRSIIDWENRELGEYYLDFKYRNYSFQLLLARIDPFHNLFYKKKFLKAQYKPKDYICQKVNLLDDIDDSQMVKSLLNKFEDWHYEEEYRMMITLNDVDKGLLSEDEFKQGLVKYQKEDLEGIVFGMKITYENAKLVYETLKKII